MVRCTLAGAVDFNATHFAAERFDCVIAVDKGYESLRAQGCEPDIAVGDFDSLGFVPKTGETLVVPAEKDESDMELAVREAIARGADELVLYGAFSRRLDHTLGNIALLAACARKGLRVFGIGDTFALSALAGGGCNELRFSAFDSRLLDGGAYGRNLSVFPFGGSARGVHEAGLKYGLAGETLADDATCGLSNEFTGAPVGVSLGEGTLIVVFPLRAWEFLAPASE